MKTMRSAFLAAGILAALITGANAQTTPPPGGVSFNETLGNFSGQFSVDSTIPTTPPIPGVFGAGSISGVGTIDSGSLFLSPTYQPGVPATEASSYYRFSLDGVTSSGPAFATVNGSNIDINQTFSGGILNIYYAGPQPAVPPLTGPPVVAGNYADRSTFRTGPVLLTANVLSLTSVLAASTTGGTSTGSVQGIVEFTGGAYFPVLQAAGLTFGEITSNISTTGVLPGYNFSANGRIVAVPEPTTIALFGAGLLPLGMFLRRRKI